MTVNYRMVSSDGGQLPHVASSDDGLFTSWLLVMTVNYLMVSSDDGSITSWLLVMAVNYLMVSSDDGQLPHGFW